MYDAIVNHAIENVWCAPLQDYEHTIMPARLTPAGGWFRYANVIWNGTLPLPHFEDTRNTKRYHVYQIGKYPDFLLGVPDLPNRWINLNEIMEKTDCFVSCFIDNGVTLKASECWLRLTKPNNNIILAVQIDHSYDLGKVWLEDNISGELSLIPSRLDNKELFIRFYTNARLKTIDQNNGTNSPNRQVEGYSKYCTTVSDVTAFVRQTYDPNRPLYGWMRVDGYVVSREWLQANPFLAVNKTVYSYHDDTIIHKQWFKLTDLKSFRSLKNPTIDKYIMFYGRHFSEVFFHNDVEYFIGIKRGDQFKGVYVPRFTDRTVTNITHAMHALDTNVVADLIENNPDFLTGHDDEIYIRAVVRRGGSKQGLVYESSRVESLYQLSNEQIMEALQDMSSVLPEWRAANLENSWYMKLMSAPTLDDITPDLVVKAYGYNALTKYMQPNINVGTPLPAPYAGTTVEVSAALTRPNNEADLYLPLDVVQYCKNGNLLESTRRLFSATGEIFLQHVDNKLPELAEVFVNNYKEHRNFRLVDNYDMIIANADLRRFGFGCYVCPLVDGKPNFKWLDVTDTDYYTYDEGGVLSTPRIIWDSAGLESAGLVGMVRINNDVSYASGTLKDITKPGKSYSVITVEDQDNGNPTMMAGQIDVWVEGKHLFQDLDYFLDWPRIYIAKEVKNRDARYMVRISGLPNPKTGKNWTSTDYGFAKDGVLGVGKPYKARHDKNLQLNVGGELKNISMIQTAEDPLSRGRVVDGLPYAFTPYVTPIEFYSGHSTLREKMKAKDLDERVDAYLGQRIETYHAQSPIIESGKRWNVVSMFFNEILSLLKTGWLDKELKQPYTNVQVSEWIRPYQFLLDMDVIYSSFFDEEFVSPVPYASEFSVDVTTEQMTFLRYIDDNYLESRLTPEKYLYTLLY